MGFDLLGTRGTPIYAVDAGRVTRSGYQGNGALVLDITDKKGSMWFYGHFDKIYVGQGDTVKAGQLIGTMGDTGSPGAVHLHFEYWRSGGESAAVDPAALISRVCDLGKGGSADEPDAADEPEPVAVTVSEPTRPPVILSVGVATVLPSYTLPLA